MILWLAWTLSHLTGTEHMRTGQFLASQLTQLDLPAGLLPTIVFILACGIALGHEDLSAPENAFITERAEVDAFASFHGF